jgi:hypothetical protein
MSDKTLLAYVYYRDLPAALVSFVSGYQTMSYTKDGALKGVGHACPRITIRYQVSDAEADKKLRARLDTLLSELESNNQIVSYSIY